MIGDKNVMLGRNFAMLEKRSWQKLLPIALALITITFIWKELSDLLGPPTASQAPSSPSYTLLTRDSASSTASTASRLPDDDYNKLIDLSFDFTSLNSEPCNSSVLLLVLVHSSPGNGAKRRAIRETWGRRDADVRLVFAVGGVEEAASRRSLDAEQRLHGDLVQGSFLDSYRNLTYKHVMGLKYFVYHCPQAKYVLKTDDDVFVNMPSMKNFLRYDLSPYGVGGGLFCTPRYNSLVLRSYRSKWRVSFSEYPEKFYPTYCPGWTLLYSPDVALGLYKEAQISEYFWIDDIHLTGTLTRRLNVTHTDIERLVLSDNKVYYIFYYPAGEVAPFLYGRELNEGQIRALWGYVVKREAPKFIFRKFG
ncbi:unnamed protein product [Phyllotreta striolata]|uniref:Hexosyltransferase n=1 Tax=Phyllotreta striolata TaxID=444603 RepID=A0A9N9U0K8_PHYSR|nr:unnamed protein product [Phyllotreta striolata]